MADKEDSTQRIPCQHTEDVCQNCLEKLQKTLDDSPPPKLVVYHEHEKPKNARDNSIYLDFYFLVLQGALTYIAAKSFLKNILQYPN